MTPSPRNPDLRWYDNTQYHRVVIPRTKQPKRGWWWEHGSEWEPVIGDHPSLHWACKHCKAFKIYVVISTSYITKYLKNKHRITDQSEASVASSFSIPIDELLSLSAELPTSLSNIDKETLRRELVERSLIN